MNRPLSFIALLLALTLLAPSARAQNFTLIDTFGPGNTFTSVGTVAGSSTIVNAVRISVPAGPDVNVVSIDMALAITGAVSSLQVGVFNESAGLPVGMPIMSGVVPGPINATLSFQSTSFTSTTPLLAGHNYWVGPFMSGTGQDFWGGGLTGSTSAAFFNGSTWASETTPNPLSIRVTVRPVSAPCCNARGTGGCVILNPADCQTVGGIIGPGSSCAAALCAINALGACCRGTTCSVTTTLGCIAVAPTARFLGVGTSCTPLPGGTNPCCPADFDNSGALSVQDIFNFLQSWFAGCP